MQVDHEAKVSVITPMYNSADYILQTIESVIAQTYKHWEMIIVDDCSQDNSVEIVSEVIKNESRVKLIKLVKNCGGAVSRNTAIREASGRYIAFLDSDDLWDSNKLYLQIKFMQENHVKMSYSAYHVCNEKSEVISDIGIPLKLNYGQLLKTNFIGCLTVIYDAAFFGKVEMPLIRKRQDYALWLKLLKEIDFAYGLNIPLARYRVHQLSLSSNKLNTSRYTWQVFFNMEKLGFIRSLYYFSQYAFRGLLRSKYPYFAKMIGVLHNAEK